MIHEDEVSRGDSSGNERKEKPHGMPLTLGSGGYGGDQCTGPEAKQAGHCTTAKPDGKSSVEDDQRQM